MSMSQLLRTGLVVGTLLVSSTSWSQSQPENLLGLKRVDVSITASDFVKDSIEVSTLKALIEARLIESGIQPTDPSNPLGNGLLVITIAVLPLTEPEQNFVMFQIHLYEFVVSYTALADMFYSDSLPKTDTEMAELTDHGLFASVWSDSSLGVLRPQDDKRSILTLSVLNMVDSFSADFVEVNGQ